MVMQNDLPDLSKLPIEELTLMAATLSSAVQAPGGFVYADRAGKFIDELLDRLSAVDSGETGRPSSPT